LTLVILSRVRDFLFWYTAEEPLDLNSDPEIELNSWWVNFPSDTGGNGLVFEFEGIKPAGIFPSPSPPPLPRRQKEVEAGGGRRRQREGSKGRGRRCRKGGREERRKEGRKEVPIFLRLFQI
jgi:hypothetical protein